jgi:hypothetical protein
VVGQVQPSNGMCGWMGSNILLCLMELQCVNLSVAVKL